MGCPPIACDQHYLAYKLVFVVIGGCNRLTLCHLE